MVTLSNYMAGCHIISSGVNPVHIHPCSLLYILADDSGLSSGEVVGVIFTVLLFLGLIAGGAYLLWRYVLEPRYAPKPKMTDDSFANKPYANLAGDTDLEIQLSPEHDA